MCHVGPLGKNLNFFVSLGIAEILGFSELSVYSEIALLKTFPQHNYASTANIEEVMKVYNPGDKTFETDFNFMNVCRLLLSSSLSYLGAELKALNSLYLTDKGFWIV